MAVPGGMSKRRYESMSKTQRSIYWVLVLSVACFIGYMLFVY